MSFFSTFLDRLSGYKTEPEDFKVKTIDIEADGSYITTATQQNTNYNFDFISNSEADLIATYRRISYYPEVSTAIDEIVNEIVSIEEDTPVIEILYEDDFPHSEAIKNKVTDAFEEVVEMLGFADNAYDLIRDWYVDSRIAFVINTDEAGREIKSLTRLDVKNLRLIKIVEEDHQGLLEVIETFYAYLRAESTNTSVNSVMSMSRSQFDTFKSELMFKIPVERVAYTDSGLVDKSSNITYGHLHKAVKAASNLEMVESSAIIYRLNRSKEVRVVYTDTGNLNPSKANALLEKIKRQFRNTTTYDSTKGTLNVSNRVMSLREDIFMSRRGGSSTTEIQNISSTGDFDDMQGVVYHKEKLYASLNVPISRFKDSSSIFAQNSEITQEELKFNQFTTRLRSKFSKLFLSVLKTKLILDKIIKEEEWKELERNIKFRFSRNSYFAELKEMEIMSKRYFALDEMSEHIGKYISNDTARRNILKQSDETIKIEDKKIAEEAEDEQFNEPETDDDSDSDGGEGGGDRPSFTITQNKPSNDTKIETKPKKKKPEDTKSDE